MKTKKYLLLVLAALAVTASTSRAVVYSIDDGVSENDLGSNTGGTVTFANSFTASAGGELIQSIEIAWGIVSNGKTFTARLWSDPNNDGNPSDAIQLASLVSTTSQANTDTFVLYDIPDVQILAGDKFFVGFTINHAVGEYPGAYDGNNPKTGSWGQLGPNFTGSPINVSGSFGDFLIRANGAPAPVPEGGATAFLLGLSLCGLAAARKRLG